MKTNFAQLTLGAIALLADLISVFSFITSGQVLSFWSATWVVMLLVIAGLLAFSLFFIHSSGFGQADLFLPLVAGIYGLLACASVLLTLWALGRRSLDLSGFIGCIVLMVFPLVMAIATGEVTSFAEKMARTISYAFAATGIAVFVLLAMRYMQGANYAMAMIGEAIVLVYVWGAFVFFAYALGSPRTSTATATNVSSLEDRRVA